ncbi:hypothetical protein [Sphingomonas astaxanthinifaciens]|uniref:Uncharacterized protein n=1 Tax=Sphingomonas astaxanthinifaciens DSM 22298 TaxID=1123267 RepID=A0ABQ5ZCE6_9SPHN|nr:hypothetical protein [Sphingomonas astaxanthinifaciens]GLR48558.1 hypothetical protein GCM10007925_22750 [Sphingomonas astaxanthinifaciens DSM 22298]
MKVTVIALGLAAMLGTSPAAAQEPPPLGTRLPKRSEPQGMQFSARSAALAGQEYANCLVEKRGTHARAMLLATTADEVGKAERSLFARGLSCQQVTGFSEMSDTRIINAEPPLMRGMLAESALRSERQQIAALPALPLQKVYSRPWLGMTGRNAIVDEMAVCITDTNPAATGRLLATSQYSKEEGEAFAALSPSFAPCLRAGARLQANRPSMRAALADAMFHRLNEPAVAAVPPTEKP